MEENAKSRSTNHMLLTFESVVINCADRLPDKPGHYLVYAPISFPKNCKWVVAEFYDDNNTFYSESNDMPLEDVSYWTTLPEYPIHGK